MKLIHMAPVAALGMVLASPGMRAAELVSAADRSFVATVSQGGMFEVKAGAVGADQGSTPDIRDQGATEAHDRQLVGDKLRSIAGAPGIQLADTLNAAFQKELKARSGAGVDAAYLRDMEAIHEGWCRLRPRGCARE